MAKEEAECRLPGLEVDSSSASRQGFQAGGFFRAGDAVEAQVEEGAQAAGHVRHAASAVPSSSLQRHENQHLAKGIDDDW